MDFNTSLDCNIINGKNTWKVKVNKTQIVKIHDENREEFFSRRNHGY